jgi:hypothetical protein
VFNRIKPQIVSPRENNMKIPILCEIKGSIPLYVTNFTIVVSITAILANDMINKSDNFLLGSRGKKPAILPNVLNIIFGLDKIHA